MPPSAFGLERDSIGRWLSDTFLTTRVYTDLVPSNFTRPSFLLEVPRASSEGVLSAAQERSTSLNATYFGLKDPGNQSSTWSSVAVAGRLEDALQDCGHLIPLRDDTGDQIGTLRLAVEWAPQPGAATELSITIRYRRLIWDRQPELEGDTLQDIHFRPT